MMIAEMVEELGHRVVAQAGTIKAAEPLAESAQFHLAILDINVGGHNILPIAQILAKRSLPFLFASGYATTALPEPFLTCPVLRKPFLIEQLSRAIHMLCSSAL